MFKILIAYARRAGKTEKMAEGIAEGIRMKGNAIDLHKISDIKNEEAIDGHDGYVFGCPTYHRHMTPSMKNFIISMPDLKAEHSH